jgi:hypothetical protein
MAFYHKVPKHRAKTQLKNFGGNDDNWTYEERVEFGSKIKDRDYNLAGVILDIGNEKTIKCSMGPNREFHSLLGYFKKSYPQYFPQEPAPVTQPVLEVKKENNEPA